MKSIKRIMLALLMVAALAIAVSAEKVTYYLNEIDASARQYDLVINIACEGEGDVRTFATTFTFNNKVMLPADCSDYSLVDLETVTDEPIFPASVKVGKKTYSYNLTDNAWTTTGDYTKLLVSCYTSDFTQFDATDLDVLTISFVLAEGVTPDDIKADDFVINKVYLAAGVNGEFGYNEPTISKELPFVNNVPNSDSDVLTISVKKDDIVYFQDDSVVKITEDNDKYELPSTKDGYVVVNTGFTAQKLYKVESGKITEVTSNENGVLATDSASLRKDSTATGLRFKTSFLTSLKDSVKEYGVLVTVESKNNDLPENYVLNMALVNAGKAKKGVAFNKANGTDIYYDVDGARTIVTAVATGIPLTKDAVTTNIAARPYYELEDGTIIYGETVKRQAAEVAQKIKNEDAETYAKYKDYIDQIIALVAEDPTYATIDLGPLFS